MKNSLVFLIAILTLSSCGANKPMIDDLYYGTEFRRESSDKLNYQEEVVEIFNKDYYLTRDFKFIKWGDARKSINPKTGKIIKLWAKNPLVVIKLKDGSGGFINNVELSNIKAEISTGEFIRNKVKRSTDKNMIYSIPKIMVNDKEYFILQLRTSDIRKYHKAALHEPYIIALIPVLSATIDIKNSCGNITLMTEEQIYILMPENVTKPDDIFLFGSYAKPEINIIPTMNKKKIDNSYSYISVKKGEGLYSVWRRAKVINPTLTYSGIKKLNTAVNPDKLEIGQKIRIK